MFVIVCPVTDRRSLLSTSRITGISNQDGGIALSYRCECGHDAVLLTGRGVRESILHPAPGADPVKASAFAA